MKSTLLENPSISRSTSSSQSLSGIDDSLLKKDSFVDTILFPLVGQLSEYTILPNFTYILFLVVEVFQSILTALWIPHNELRLKEGEFSILQKIIFSIACFSPMDSGNTSYSLRFFIYLGVIMLSVLILCIQIVVYQKNRRFSKPFLYPIRFILELIPLIMMMPTGVLFGQIFGIFFKPGGSKIDLTNVIFFIFSFLMFVFMCWGFYVINLLFGKSAYLQISPITAFNSYPFLSFSVGNSVFATLSFFLEPFSHWLVHIQVVIHIIFLASMISKFLWLPFIRNSTNCLFLFMSYFSVLLDLMRLVMIFFKFPSEIISLAAFFVLLIIAIVLSIFTINLIDKRIIKNLQRNVGQTTDKENIERLVTLGLDNNENRMMAYFNQIIKHQLIQFYDVPIIRFMMQCYKSSTILIYLIRVASFQPYLTHSLGILLREAGKRHDLKLSDRFMIYQVNRIRILRQSSSSDSAATRLKELKSATYELQSQMAKFWIDNKPTPANSLSTYKHIFKLKSLWDEAINDYPNNNRFNEEYVIFLVECCTDFSEAIKIRHKVDMIDSGYNFCIDNSYRHFVRNFPNYVKQKILDLKGNRMKKSNQSGSESSKSDNSKQLSVSSTTSELDVAVEEGIGKSLLSFARVRLVIQRAIDARKADKNSALLAIILINLIIGFVLFIFLFVYFNGYYDTREETAAEIEYMNSARYDLISAAFSLTMFWGNSTIYKQTTSIMDSLISSDKDVNPIYSQNETWDQRAVSSNLDARANFQEFIQRIVSMSLVGTNVYFFAANIFEVTTPVFYCTEDAIPTKNITYQNLEATILYMLMAVSISVSNRDTSTWFTKGRQFCTLTKTLTVLSDSFDGITNTLELMAQNDVDKATKEIGILNSAMPAIYGILTCSMIIAITILYSNEITNFLNLLVNMPNNAKNEAVLPLRKIVESDEIKDDSSSSIHSKFHFPIIFGVVICALNVAISLIITFQMNNLNHFNSHFQYFAFWSSDSRIRKTLITHICLMMLLSSAMQHSEASNTKFVDTTFISQMITSSVSHLDEVTSNIFTDSGGTPSIAGENELIDFVSLKEICSPNLSNPSFHENYKCASAQALVSFFINQITSARNTIDEGKIVTDDKLANMFHLASAHLVPSLIKIDGYLSNLANQYNTSFKNNHITFFIVEIIVLLINLVISIVFVKLLCNAYSVCLIYLRRLSPVSVVANKKLIQYLLTSDNNDDTSQMSLDKTIIHSWTNCVLCTDVNGIIDVVNPYVSRVLGYTPEQLLGQPIFSIFGDESNDEIEQQLKLMANKQSCSSFSSHISCVTDENTLINCEIAILGMCDEKSGLHDITSFVFILTDESKLILQQKEAELAKRQSEELLYNILPRTIVIRLNQGEKDISFTVHSSTIMFIDIVKFSDYMSTLTPQDVMANLSQLFAGFDEAIGNYSSMIKIKLIGDVYMCAGGLFSQESDNPQIHAEQAMRFGLDALAILEEINLKLNAVLNVRIGANTGGPLIGGVLGTDKPTFDIIGDPINVASRLQSTSIPGRIQVSQSTYDLLEGLDFYIEQRGEVFLKGKGKTMAYFVFPKNILQFQFSSTVNDAS